MASYFLGVREGKGQESGKKYWCCSLLLCNTFGNWVSKEYFIPEPVYGRIVSNSKFTVGSAVIPVFDGSGNKPSLKKIRLDGDADSIVLVPDDDWEDDE